jgi:SAM-dependent methyltransferase
LTSSSDTLDTATSSTYSAVASEYYDSEAHPTCYNFNRLSRIYIERRTPEPLRETAILEVGAGDSTIAAVLHARGYQLNQLEITDDCLGMLAHSQRWTRLGARLRCTAAGSLGIPNASVSLLVAGLGDPYNTVEFWREVHRVLQPVGRVIFTLPSFEWAARFRAHEPDGSIGVAEFRLRDGRIVRLPSLVRPLDAQVELIEETGLVLSHFEAFDATSLGTDRISPKIAFLKAPVSIVWGFEARKLDDPISRRTRQRSRESFSSPRLP